MKAIPFLLEKLPPIVKKVKIKTKLENHLLNITSISAIRSKVRNKRQLYFVSLSIVSGGNWLWKSIIFMIIISKKRYLAFQNALSRPCSYMKACYLADNPCNNGGLMRMERECVFRCLCPPPYGGSLCQGKVKKQHRIYQCYGCALKALKKSKHRFRFWLEDENMLVVILCFFGRSFLLFLYVQAII